VQRAAVIVAFADLWGQFSMNANTADLEKVQSSELAPAD
jgi:hypothetical protein